MATSKKPALRKTPGYRGKITRTGNSLGLRFDRALFQSHPEFSGEVRAHVIAPGRMLVIAEQPIDPRKEEDPVMKAFLSYLEQGMVKSPHRVKPLKAKLCGPHEDYRGISAGRSGRGTGRRIFSLMEFQPAGGHSPHPLFEKQLEKLIRQVERLKPATQKGYAAHPASQNSLDRQLLYS